jgi:hypothetical protein
MFGLARPVTPEVAGSSPVAPVPKRLHGTLFLFGGVPPLASGNPLGCLRSNATSASATKTAQ